MEVKLNEKFASRQVTAMATLKGWQATVANPARGKAGEPVVIPNPLTAETFVQKVLKREFEDALITHEARLSAADVERTRRQELEKEMGR